MDSWVDGQPADTLSLKDRGLAYGDGLFETIAVRSGQPLLLDRHLTRLADGCSRLAIAADYRSGSPRTAAFMRRRWARACSSSSSPVATACAVTRRIRRRLADAFCKAILLRLIRWFMLNKASACFRAARGYPKQPLLAGLKHLNRLEQVLARAEWQDSEHAEGLMLDQAGRVIEGVFSNVFVVRDGVLITPDLKRCGVAGVMRAEILFQAESLAIPTQIADISLEQLQWADEVFVCNSVYGVWPVRAYAALSWPVGPLTRKLQAIARALLDA